MGLATTALIVVIRRLVSFGFSGDRQPVGHIDGEAAAEVPTAPSARDDQNDMAVDAV